jgi:hypothetical protein
MAHKAHFNTEGTLVPSVTTVLKILNKPALLAWANYMGFKRMHVDVLLDTSARIGSAVHLLIECELMNYTPIMAYGDKYIRITSQRLFSNYMDWRKNNHPRPILMEHSMTCNTFGGTTDFYGEFNGLLTVMDFKTSKRMYMSMFIQLAGYIILLEKEGRVVEQATIVLVNDRGVTTKSISRDDMEEYIGIFKIIVFLYHKLTSLLERDKWEETI